jgi:hypothetical protein
MAIMVGKYLAFPIVKEVGIWSLVPFSTLTIKVNAKPLLYFPLQELLFTEYFLHTAQLEEIIVDLPLTRWMSCLDTINMISRR